MNKYVCLYRISTSNDVSIKGKKARKNLQTGLGLEAQQHALHGYVEHHGGSIIKEFKEYESAVNKERISLNAAVSLDTLLSKRPVLLDALDYAKQNNAILLVKEVSRLTRNKLLGEYLMAAGVKFLCTDYPSDSTFMLSMRINIEHDNALRTAERTSVALQAKIRREGTWQKASEPFKNGEATALATAARKRKAENNENNIRAASLVCLLRKEGFTLKQVAEELNKQKFRTSKGFEFNSIQVSRIERSYC